MHYFVFLVLTARLVQALNGPCTVGNTPGVCITMSSCSSGGGTSTAGHCPSDLSNVMCCTKLLCGSGGNCRFSDSCASGNTASGLCPGPSNFQCCLISTGGASNCKLTPVNAATVTLIKEFESFVPSPSPDPIGLPTVGYGHRCKQPGCAEVPFMFPLSEAQASTLLQTDLNEFTQCVSDDVADSVQLNDNQYSALVSWAYNVGRPNVKSSTLIRRLNAGEDPNIVAAQELPRWNMGGGQILPGLVRRRAAEVKLFQTPSTTIAHPAC